MSEISNDGAEVKSASTAQRFDDIERKTKWAKNLSGEVITPQEIYDSSLLGMIDVEELRYADSEDAMAEHRFRMIVKSLADKYTRIGKAIVVQEAAGYWMSIRSSVSQPEAIRYFEEFINTGNRKPIDDCFIKIVQTLSPETYFRLPWDSFIQAIDSLEKASGGGKAGEVLIQINRINGMIHGGGAFLDALTKTYLLKDIHKSENPQPVDYSKEAIDVLNTCGARGSLPIVFKKSSFEARLIFQRWARRYRPELLKEVVSPINEVTLEVEKANVQSRRRGDDAKI